MLIKISFHISQCSETISSQTYIDIDKGEKLSEMLRHRCPDGEEKSDASTYVSIVDLRCCNNYFRMFHGEYCMKHCIYFRVYIRGDTNAGHLRNN